MMSYFFAPIHVNLKPNTSMCLQSITRLISGGAFQFETKKIRGINKIGSKKDYRDAKLRYLPGISQHCICTYREDKSVVETSGYFGLDYDHIDDETRKKIKTICKQNKNVSAYWDTVSGEGLRIMIKTSYTDTNPKRFAIAYTKVALQFDKLFNVSHDKACKNISRISFLNYDYHVYFNKKAAPIHVVVDENDTLTSVRPSVEFKRTTNKNTKKIKSVFYDRSEKEFGVCCDMIKRSLVFAAHNNMTKAEAEINAKKCVYGWMNSEKWTQNGDNYRKLTFNNAWEYTIKQVNY